MSGRAKRTVYRTVELLLVLFAVAGIFFMFYSAFQSDLLQDPLSISVCVVGFVILLPVATVFLHETGHLSFGLLAGLRFYSFSVRFLQIGRGGRVRLITNPDFAGKTVMLPKKERGARGKLLVFSLGGVLFNLIYGCVFLSLYFLVPQTPALLLFELLAPLSLFEGLLALIPAELSAGRTDGSIAVGLIGNTPYARVMQAVLTAQGVLVKGSYPSVSRRMIFDAPVIREDDPLFLSLTQLRWQFCYCNGEKEEALAQIGRLRALCDYTDSEEAFCDVAWGTAVLGGDKKGAEAFLAENDVLPTPIVRVALFREGEEEALREIARERNAGLKELKEKMLADSKNA